MQESIAFLKCSEEIGQSRTRHLKALVPLSVRFQKYNMFLQALSTSVSFLHVWLWIASEDGFASCEGKEGFKHWSKLNGTCLKYLES